MYCNLLTHDYLQLTQPAPFQHDQRSVFVETDSDVIRVHATAIPMTPSNSRYVFLSKYFLAVPIELVFYDSSRKSFNCNDACWLCVFKFPLFINHNLVRRFSRTVVGYDWTIT
jgi:hypothetical protein